MNKNVFVICGPTSTGKTSLALDICKSCNAQILSADSRQVVKYMDIGTGKVPINGQYAIRKFPDEKKWTIDGVTVWGYDLTDPITYFSAYDYVQYAREILLSRNNIIVVGGTGFYIDVLTGIKTVSEVLPNDELRTTLDAYSLTELQEELQQVSPGLFERIDTKNKVRLIRAIEIAKADQVKQLDLPGISGINFVFLGLTGSRDVLYSRTDTWLDLIWSAGLITEVKELLATDYKSSPKFKGLIYKSVKDYLEGQLSEHDAKARCKFDLHAYIRRQQTWFKKNKAIKWFDISSPSFDTEFRSEFKAWNCA